MDTTELENDLTRKCAERVISGRDMKKIREQCGYSAREFAEMLCSIGARITTARSVYRLEERWTIPSRYVDALTKLVGSKNFTTCLRTIIKDEEELQRRREELWRKREEVEQERERIKAERRQQRDIRSLLH